MGRPLRVEYPGALYHVTSRGNEKRDIFLDDRDRRKFLGLLEEHHDRHGILIHCYVLMGNHYHLVVETPGGNLITVMHGINSTYTGYFNRGHNRAGHLFQGRYSAILVDKDAYLLQVSRYVHLNPVRAGMVDRPERYEWSSYPGYVWKSREVPWVEYAWVLSQFGRSRRVGREKYGEFVSAGVQQTAESPFRDLYGQVMLGRDQFIEQTKGLLGAREVSQEIVERKRLMGYAEPEDIVSAVASALQTEADLLKRKGGRNNTARRVAMYLMKRYSGLSNEEIGQFFGGLHYSAVSKSYARLEHEMGQNRELRSLVQGLMSHVKSLLPKAVFKEGFSAHHKNTGSDR